MFTLHFTKSKYKTQKECGVVFCASSSPPRAAYLFKYRIENHRTMAVVVELKVSKSQRRKINDFKLNICHYRDNLLLFSLLMLISINPSKWPFFIWRRGEAVGREKPP